jgi:two-component system, LytTR family, sensor kinase
MRTDVLPSTPRSPSPTDRPATPIWLLLSAAWVGPAILGALDTYVQSRLGNGPAASWRLITWTAGDWLIYGMLTPIVFRLARLFPLRPPVLRRNIAVHLLASLALCAVWAGAGTVLRALLIPGPEGEITVRGAVSWLFTTLPFGVLVYFAVIVAERAAHYFVEVQSRETQAARLSAQLAEARLSALRMQLHPHFLFNSLNALAVLVRDQDTPAASRMLELLSAVLHEVLHADQTPETSLETEIAFLHRYLEIERIRFSDRLRPIFDIDPAVSQAAVPAFVLQPIVENALRHGIAKRTAAGTLRLVLTVEDDGPGPPAPTLPDGPGVGLANTRARLLALHGPLATVGLRAAAASGAIATLRFPYREFTSRGTAASAG